MIIVENKHVLSTFSEDQKILISVFKGRVDIDLLLDHLSNSVSFYNNYNVIGSVADISQVHGSFVKIMDFMKETYYPAAIKSGVKCAAYVISKDLINSHLGVKLELIASSFNIKSAVFSELSEAEDWVRTRGK